MFRYVICPVNSSVPIGELYLSDVSWNDPCYGSGGIFSGKAEVSNQQDRDKLTQLTAPDGVALYVLDSDTGQWLFGGPIVKRPWSISERKLSVQAQSWKSWTYQKLCGMNRSNNPVTDLMYKWTNQDQFYIAQQLLNTVVNGDIGCPSISIGSELSGVSRSLTFHGSDQKFLGDQIDLMANRDNGFEWSIGVRSISNPHHPELYLSLYYPLRGGLNNQAPFVHDEITGGNVLDISDPEDTTENRRSRVWSSGAGQPPDQSVAFDEDPSLINGYTLLRETVRSYSSVISVVTLADHARAERLYRNHGLQQVSLVVGIDDPLYTSYESGDKIPLMVRDAWINWSFRAVRIIDKTFQVDGLTTPDTVKLLIDLNDINPPENDTVL